VVGLLGPAANGTDAQLRFVAAPADGSPAPAPGQPVVTFGGGADPRNPLPMMAMGTSASAMYAGASWLDPQSGFPSYAFVDAQGQVLGGKAAVIENEPASGYSCLGFSPGKQELTISYQRGPTDPLLGPSWLIADVAVNGAVSTLKLNVAQPGGTMSCARGALYPTGGGGSEYAIVWQDNSGSWLSIYYGAQTGQVKSFPFAASTDFGGPDLQPPLIALAALNSDFGVLHVRAHSVEMWRVDQNGNRRSGSLVLPSVEGNVAGAAGVASKTDMQAPTDLLVGTYADLMAAGPGRRLVVDATCQ
jgi:hypothetical protein